MTHREGGDPSHERKSPGKSKYDAVTLERGVTHDPDFEDWANLVHSLESPMSLKNFRKDIVVDVFNEAGQKVLSYKLFRCWVSEYQALPALDAATAAIAIETDQARARRLGARRLRDRTGRELIRPCAPCDRARADTSMSTLTDLSLLELDAPTSEVGQVVAVLHAAGVEGAPQCTLGDGDRRLLALAVQCAGGPLEIAVMCPACGECNSIELDLDVFGPSVPASAWWGPGGGLRQPTYADLVASAVSTADPIVTRLLAQCTVGSPPRPPTVEDLARIDDSLSGPVRLECFACRAPIEADIDVQHAALERLVRRSTEVGYEIHLLAREYHWDLATIEGLSDARRRSLARFVAESR